jgi:threonine/homoserine/homoserine lactone efflux protein
MELLLLGAGMGVVGGMIPCPLHFIALTQVALNRWLRAILILVGPPVAVDGLMLLVTFFFYHYIPASVAHYVAYLGGAVLIGFASYSLSAAKGKTQAEMANSTSLTYASVTTATLTELTAPGTWIYWMTVAGPILSEGRLRGYWHVVPFFVGGLVGYYGAAVVSLRVLAWGASLHKRFQERLFLAANVLLLFLGISYLVRAYFGR